jgi:hypothetical protein
LSGFQLSQYTRTPTYGVLDVPLFGLRFKVIDHIVEGDSDYQVIHVVKEQDISSDIILLRLAEQGYLHWLRTQISSHAFFKILSSQNRWELLVKRAIELILLQKKGTYLLNIAKNLKGKSLLEIYHHQPDVFDWLLR